MQTLIERNMEKFFNVKFLASEYIISEGRMDSVGIDENNAPVIFEYKRSKDENVISQGLFYMAWLMEHKDSFVVLAQERLHKKIAKEDIAWDGARVICVANDFTKVESVLKNDIIHKSMGVIYRIRVATMDFLLDLFTCKQG